MVLLSLKEQRVVISVECCRGGELGKDKRVCIGLAMWRSLLVADDKLEYLLDKGSEYIIPRKYNTCGK